MEGVQSQGHALVKSTHLYSKSKVCGCFFSFFQVNTAIMEATLWWREGSSCPQGVLICKRASECARWHLGLVSRQLDTRKRNLLTGGRHGSVQERQQPPRGRHLPGQQLLISSPLIKSNFTLTHFLTPSSCRRPHPPTPFPSSPAPCQPRGSHTSFSPPIVIQLVPSHPSVVPVLSP